MAVYYGHVTEVEGPVDPGFGRPKPQPPNQIWPPSVWPPIPPDVQPPQMWPPQINNDLPPSSPIVIPQPPEKPIQGPPGTVWPPLPPGTGIAGKALVLIYVVGVGYRWLVVDGPDMWPPPPSAGPK